MSTCISRRGEYSDHIPDDAYVCTRCGVLDEDGLIAELRELRADKAYRAELESAAQRSELEIERAVGAAREAFRTAYAAETLRARPATYWAGLDAALTDAVRAAIKAEHEIVVKSNVS